jgi:hypothetical protein
MDVHDIIDAYNEDDAHDHDSLLLMVDRAMCVTHTVANMIKLGRVIIREYETRDEDYQTYGLPEEHDYCHVYQDPRYLGSFNKDEINTLITLMHSTSDDSADDQRAITCILHCYDTYAKKMCVSTFDRIVICALFWCERFADCCNMAYWAKVLSTHYTPNTILSEFMTLDGEYLNYAYVADLDMDTVFAYIVHHKQIMKPPSPALYYSECDVS